MKRLKSCSPSKTTQRKKRIGEDFVFKNWGEGEGGEVEICPNQEEKYTFINVEILEIKKKKSPIKTSSL